MLTQSETKLEFASKVENITMAEKLIDDVRELYSIGEDVYANILVAVTEAVNNAINHGNKLDPSKNVTVQCDQLTDKVIFTIKDEGPGFNYYNLPDPTSPENLEKVNGRGIFLMKHLSDQLIFSNEGKTVEMHFLLHDLSNAS